MTEFARQMADSLYFYMRENEPRSVVSTYNDYQRECTLRVEEGLRLGHTRMFLKSPTGTRKTRMGMGVLEGTRIITPGPGEKALWVTPTIPLIGQTMKEFRTYMPGVSATTYYGGNKDLSGEVAVTTYVSALKGVAKGDIVPERYTRVIYDEAHHLLPKERLVEIFGHTVQVGLTATAGYGVNRHLRDVLPYEAVNTSIREAVERNLLSSFSVFLVKTGVDLDSVPVLGSGENREYDQKSLAKAVNIAARNQAAVDVYKQFDGSLAVAFCAGIDHAKAVAQRFRDEGITAEVVWGDQDSKSKERILEAYHKGEIKVLCNADLLIEGFDEKKASLCLNLRPTMSPVIAEQRGGRVLRFDEDNPLKYAFIIDFVDTSSNPKKQPISFAHVAEAAQITNRFHKSNPERFFPPLFKREPYFELSQGRLIAHTQEVMWAVNNDYREIVPFVSSEWKTLSRMGAETGIPSNALSLSADQRRDRFDQWGFIKQFESPPGNWVEHYFTTAQFFILESLLNSLGESWSSNDSDTYPRSYNRFLTQLRKRLGKVESAVIRRQMEVMFEIMDSDKQKYWGVVYESVNSSEKGTR